MLYSTLALAILAPVALALPNAAPAPPLIYTDGGITSGTTDPAHDKRALIYTDGGITTPTDSDISKRSSNYISSCGDNWMWINDGPGGTYQGYKSAVTTFCYRQTHNLDGKPLVLSHGQASSARISGGLQLTNKLPAAVNFEIHNKLKDGVHTVVEADCVTYLMKMAATGTKCFGKNNYDTKGGTWQVGDDQVSYHALPEAVV
ncbi:MAG: hypothetical protein M1814_001230 [Vezdaea aestivalis]|nr:MAG: hypothetical protein M1814_001230 [Vezdaea aestivalis]